MTHYLIRTSSGYPALIFLLCYTLPVLSQNTQVRDNDYLYYSYHNYPYELDYREIDGSPYLADTLLEGYIRMTDGGIVKIPLRYNIYEDEIEYLDDQKLMVLKNVDQVDFINMGSDTLVYRNYNDGSDSGYFFQKVSGVFKLYEKYIVEYQEMKAPITSYHSPKPPSFVNRAPLWYISMDNGPMVEVDLNSTDLDQVFGTHTRTMKEYKKKQKLKFGREEDVIEIFQYFNHLLKDK